LLKPSTTYHYRLVASNSQGASYGADASFTTSGSGALPTATTSAAHGTTTNRATANGSANPNGLTTTVVFQFGTTTAYGSTTGSQAGRQRDNGGWLLGRLVLLKPSTTTIIGW